MLADFKTKKREECVHDVVEMSESHIHDLFVIFVKRNGDDLYIESRRDLIALNVNSC